MELFGMTVTEATTQPAEPAGVRELAESLMAQHGLTGWTRIPPGYPTGWTLVFDQAKTRAGMCDRSKRTIQLSAPLMSLWTTAQVRETVLHEIAHALAPAGSKHGPAWQAIARKIGADPVRTWGHDGEQEVPPKYTGTCPAGHTLTRHKLTKSARRGTCSACNPRYDPRYPITWTENEQT